MGSPTLVTPDGRVWVPQTDAGVDLPDCFIAGPEHNGRVYRYLHDATPRLPGMITNEISVLRGLREDGLKVSPYSKVSVNINYF